MNPPTTRSALKDAITAFQNPRHTLRSAALGLFQALGYQSDRSLAIASVAQFCEQFDSDGLLNHPRAQKQAWQSIQLLFQLTDEELARHVPVFKDSRVKPALLQSYVFFALELSPPESGTYTRGELASITRQINRIFPMPVMVLFKVAERLSIAVINRRQNKRDDSKDVLGKVTLIQNISITQPHPGHLDILASFSTTELLARKKPIANFDDLHAAWEDVFNVELLNKRFYEELSNWYFWARKQVSFPADLEPDADIRNATSVIRLLTRLVFCWFLKEKGLIPGHLFDQPTIQNALTTLDDGQSSYYHAILQNLFFATLNQPMLDNNGKPARQFASDGGGLENRKQYGIKTLYRYQSAFARPDTALALFEGIPFLNGGLFACLDLEDETGKVQYADGFSRNAKKQPSVPNHLFFAAPHTTDLSEAFGDAKKKKAPVRGLLHILHGYTFTITENTPVEQEIALDPELLGKVFENLLASYNPETGTNARRQTGSFYTPRTIVDYMVDQTLKAHLASALQTALPNTTVADAQAGLDILFAYTEKEHAFTEAEIDVLINAINTCKILDPACGSGAYPMGILHKLVFILGKLDPNNQKWLQRQLDKAQEIEDVQARESALVAIKNDFANNALDYGRKLYLIENCIYGADIQPIAIQIAKLRFFISLICDQRTNTDKTTNTDTDTDKTRNLGVRPLPNLETRFVAANSLLGLNLPPNLELFENKEITLREAELEKVRHQYFSAQTRDTKMALQKRDRELSNKIIDKLQLQSTGHQDLLRRIAWNPYSHHSVADFFDPGKMFGPALQDGFDVVIGNPPYVQIQKFPAKAKQDWAGQDFKTYAATADIYCLFYERGARLLKQGGHLSFITSNKWMRAGYGEKLREFFCKDVAVSEVIDFGGVAVFSAAMVDTAIVRLSKSTPPQQFQSSVLTRSFSNHDSLAEYVNDNAVPFDVPSAGAVQSAGAATWVLMEPARFHIKQAVAKQGVALADWHISIYRGILTGYNDAFYISTAQRDAFIAEDPRCADLIVPLLRGRYVDKYATQWEGAGDEKWLINSHNGVKDLGIPAVNLQADYPVLWRHLSAYKTELSKRLDKGDNWFNLRNCAYLQDFSKPKIIYPNMTKYMPFYLDTKEHFFINDKAFIISSDTESLAYLTAIFNSTLFRCCFRDSFPNLGEDRRELRKIFMDKIPIKKPTPQQATLFEALVCLVQATKAEAQQPNNTPLQSVALFLEQVIDACVMEVYFPTHMAQHHLSLLPHILPLLQNFTPTAPTTHLETARHFHTQANHPHHPIRNLLTRIPADSPDLLGVIQREGEV